MLLKINRLKNTAEIEKVFKDGKGFKEGFLFLKLAENNLGVSRFAFVVSRKISKKAAYRNKIKRRLREVIKGLLSRAKTGLDVVIVVQGGVENKSFQEIQKNTEKILKKAKII